MPSTPTEPRADPAAPLVPAITPDAPVGPMANADVRVLAPRLRGISHAYAFVVSIAAAVIAVVIAPSTRTTISAAVYGAGLVALFGGSAVYHRWPGSARFKP